MDVSQAEGGRSPDAHQVNVHRILGAQEEIVALLVTLFVVAKELDRALVPILVVVGVLSAQRREVGVGERRDAVRQRAHVVGEA